MKRFVTAALLAALAISSASARDVNGRYANSDLKPWFDSLKSKKGPCCSDADGTALKDPEWKLENGRYHVWLEGMWIEIDDDALITEPNKVGTAMVWPFYPYSQAWDPTQPITPTGKIKPSIRCFLPGSLG